MNITKAQIIREFKETLKSGNKVYFPSEFLDEDFDIETFIEYVIEEEDNDEVLDCYLLVKNGLIYSYIDDKLDGKLSIEEVAKILDFLAERQVSNIKELQAVAKFLDS